MTQVDSTWVAPPLTAGPREDGCIGISKSSPSLRTFLPLLSQIQHVGPVSLSIIIIFSPWRSHVRRRGWVSVRRWRQYSHDVLADGGFDEGVCFSLGDISGRNLNQFCPPDVVVSAASRWQLKAGSPAAICLRVQGPGVISVLRTRRPQARRRFSTPQPSPVYTAEDCGTR